MKIDWKGEAVKANYNRGHKKSSRHRGKAVKAKWHVGNGMMLQQPTTTKVQIRMNVKYDEDSKSQALWFWNFFLCEFKILYKKVRSLFRKIKILLIWYLPAEENHTSKISTPNKVILSFHVIKIKIWKISTSYGMRAWYTLINIEIRCEKSNTKA